MVGKSGVLHAITKCVDHSGYLSSLVAFLKVLYLLHAKVEK